MNPSSVPTAHKLRVAEVVASVLKAKGVPYLFGIPGGGSSIDLIESCGRQGIPFVLAQHETTSAMMAAVCAQLTDSCGVCLSIMGPGAVNLAGGASYAYWERHPLLAMTETYGFTEAPSMSIQKMDHSQLFGGFSKQSVTLESSAPGRQLEEAIQRACSERPGPVHVDLPLHIMNQQTGSPRASLPSSAAHPAPEGGDLDKVAHTIEAVARPVLVVGPVVQRQKAESALLGLIEKLQLATLVTSKARGVISENHPYFAGVVTGAYGQRTFEGKIIHQSNLVVAIGLDRMELLSPWDYPQPMVSLDAIPVPEQEQVGQPLVKAYGPLTDLLESLSRRLSDRRIWDAAALEVFWDEVRHALGATEGDLNAGSLLARARQLAPQETILTTETGIYNAVNLYLWKVPASGTYFGSSGANTMGYSIPAALGTSLLRPDRKTVALVGDGGFLMRASELETALRLKLAPVIIIFDDGTLGLIRIKQQAKGYHRAGVDLASTDFVRLAESFGGRGWMVRTLEDFDAAFRKALSSDQLTLIDARLDPDVYASHMGPIRGI